jgi:hypothetical protein
MNEEQELRLRILGMLLPALSGERTDRELIRFAKSLERYVTKVCTECAHPMSQHTCDDGCTVSLPRRGACSCSVRS